MSIVIITGTGTDVGKTVATAAVTAALVDAGRHAIPVKPVQTGEPEGHGDLATVEKLTGVPGVGHLRYPDPLAPDLAAARAGLPAPDLGETATFLADLQARHTGATLLVEGAGGLLVRLGRRWTIVDLALRLDAPMLVVTSLGLGSLNAAALTVTVARDRGVRVLGLIGGALPEDPDLATRLNLEALPEVTGVDLLATLPAGAGGLDRTGFGEMARARLGKVVEALAVD